MKFEIWVRLSTSEAGKYRFLHLGVSLGKTFEEACKVWCSTRPWYNRYYHQYRNTILGYRLFDSEASARDFPG